MADLIVIYTERLDACRDWWSALGLDPILEQHGTGPVHYAITLPDGCVVELYPAGERGATGRLRLGLTLPATPAYPAGRHKLADPDGRTVGLAATEN